MRIQAHPALAAGLQRVPMKARLATIGALTASTMVFVCSPAWGASPPSPIVRDAGDATAATPTLKAVPAAEPATVVVVTRDAGDATATRDHKNN